mmetsp:Transcript_8951/g.13567  ORF Transcript_8951/g.13567 Transcript_8951/m.13567 type:complete len:213 (-) Transcript_8951:54-692(-)
MILFSVDPTLGRVEIHSLPQQTIMELLISGFENKAILYGNQDEPPEIEYWNSIVFDDAKEVIEIYWCKYDLWGLLNLKWLPTTLKVFSIYTNKLSGSIDLTCLPDGIQVVDLRDNAFSGEVSLACLPESLICLDISFNRFFGTINLTKLPSQMQGLSLRNNRFSGRPDFDKLPSSLKCLLVSHTSLSGKIMKKDFVDVEVEGSSVDLVEDSP